MEEGLFDLLDTEEYLILYEESMSFNYVTGTTYDLIINNVPTEFDINCLIADLSAIAKIKKVELPKKSGDIYGVLAIKLKNRGDIQKMRSKLNKKSLWNDRVLCCEVVTRKNKLRLFCETNDLSKEDLESELEKKLIGEILKLLI